LAVEEQFYLLFPLLLTFLIRSRPVTWQRWILCIAIGSLIIGVVGSYSSHNQRAAFYLLPGRAWELLLGALLSIHSGRLVFGRMVRESLGFLGLALILFAVLVYDESTRFPGLAALAPCLGAAMIIASSNVQLSAVGQLLSFRPFIFIGLVSYPLYLWHWPMLVFARYLSIHELTDALSIQLLLASLLLAVLSWKFVETPIRQHRWLGEPRQIFKSAGIVTGVFLAIAFSVAFFQGFPSRFPAKALAYAASRDRHSFGDEIDLARAQSGRFMELGSAEGSKPISLLIWGDSHAKAIAPALDQLCREHSRRGVLAAHSGTPPLLNYICSHEDSLLELSPKAAESVVAFIAKHEIKNVVLAARWALYPASAEFKDCLILTVRSLLESGTNVVVLKEVPTPGFEVPHIAFLTALRGDDLEDLGVTKEKHKQLGAELEPAFVELAKMGATVLDPSNLFLNSRGIYGVIENDKILYYDSNHLSIEGAELLKPLFRPIFQAK
jgi:hypothetical protein